MIGTPPLVISHSDSGSVLRKKNDRYTSIGHFTGVRVFTGSGLITGSDRIGPEIGLFLCLTDCFFFTRMMCIKDYVFSAICMHLNILILI